MIIMTVRRINYTGRKKIDRKSISIDMRYPSFFATLRLGGYDLPENARVFVEAYRQTTRVRCEFGKVGGIVPPEKTDISELETPEAIKFRVLVVDTAGKILARADRISADNESPATRNSLLPVRPAELENAVYRLYMGVDGDDEPILHINSRFENWSMLATSSQFYTLVFPALVREILTCILIVEDHRDTSDMSDWKSQWLVLAWQMCGEMPPQGADDDSLNKDAQVWIDKAVAGFCKNHDVASRYLQHWDRREE